MDAVDRVVYKIAAGQRGGVKEKVNFRWLLIRLSQNRLLYYFSQTLRNAFGPQVDSVLKKIYLDGQRRRGVLEKTLNLIEQISKKSNLGYIIAKLDRTIPYVNCDIDLLINEQDVDKWLDALINVGYSAHAHKTFLKGQAHQRILKKDDFYKIDLTTQFNWQDKIYFDQNFLWSGYNKKTHRMGKEADFLVNFAAIIFKRTSINLLDYLYLKKLMMGKLNWQLVERQVKRYGWAGAYKAAFRFLSSIDINDSFPKIFYPSVYFSIFREKLGHGEFSINYFAYLVLSIARYYLLGRTFLPFHVYWYPILEIKNIKNLEVGI